MQEKNQTMTSLVRIKAFRLETSVNAHLFDTHALLTNLMCSNLILETELTTYFKKGVTSYGINATAWKMHFNFISDCILSFSKQEAYNL